MDVLVNVFIWFTFMHGDNFQMQDRADGRVVLAIMMRLVSCYVEVGMHVLVAHAYSCQP
jgi:hypothetical protein